MMGILRGSEIILCVSRFALIGDFYLFLSTYLKKSRGGLILVLPMPQY